MKVVLKACSGRRNGKGFGERNHVWFDPASPSLIVHNKATLKQEVQCKVFNKGYHVWLKSAYPSLMVDNEDIPAQEMDGKAPQSGDQILSNSANPSLLGEISNYEHMCKPSTLPGGRAHASSTLQLEHSRSWEMMSIEDALTCLEHMPEPPSVVDFISVLQKCRKGKILGFITRAHAHLCDNGLEAHGVLGNVLVQMFVECGSLSDAHQVFSRLVHRNEYSWTSLIQGYNEYGDFQKALQLFTEMQEDCVDPSRYTFVALLKACAGKKCMERVREIHTKVIREELETDPFIGNSLVSVYAKCGLLFEARKVFDSLPVPTIVSWTALIAGYAEHGLGKEALSCLGQMQLEGMCPNAFTFACCLKACGSIGAIGKGQQIHCVIVVDGHGRDLYVGNALVDMYAKCGLLMEAQEVFNVLPARDVVTWTALIAGYADHGLGEEALNYLQQMQNQTVPMNAVTFVCSLKACGSIGGMERGQVIHIKIVKEGFELDPFVGNALVDMYAKCGSLVEAQAVFDWLPARSVISWNILIAGYSEHGFEKQALVCFEQMHKEGVCMDAATFICSLKACGSIGAVDMGRELHAEIAKEGFEMDPFVGNSLVDMYAKCSALVEAQEVLTHLPVQNVVAWTAVIAIYAEHGLGKEALNVLEEMQVQGISPDIVTFVYGLQACGSIAAVDSGRELHSQIVKHAFERDSYVSNTLVDMYDKCHSLTEARNLFDHLPVRSAASWSALIAGYAENGLGGEALNLLEQMQLEGLSPNAATFVSSLRACGTIGAVDRGQELHSEVVKKGLLVDTAAESGKSFNAEVGGTAATEEIIGNALIDMYAKCGSLVDSQMVFNAMPKRSLMTWNTLMIGFTRKGQNDLVFGLFDRLREEGVQPNEVTFLSVLTACSHAGLVGKGQKYFKAMGREFGTNPTIEHYNCMIDLLGRAGQLAEAVKLLEKMPLQPNMATWNTILAACRKWGNVELGRRALECAMRLDENHAAAFISMYNIYADAHMWTDAKKIKAMRRKVKAR